MIDAPAYTRLAAVYDEIVVDPCYPHWAQYLHELWEQDLEEVRSVLDVCCGTGLMDRELLRLGYSVTGTDSSAEMLARARALLGDGIELIHSPLPKLGTDRTFDAAISTFDGLNYLNLQEFRDSIKELSQHLRAGGWLCFDLHTDAMLDFTEKNAEVSGVEEGHRFSIHSVVDRQRRTCDTWIEVLDIQHWQPFREHHRQYFHSDEHVALALADAGFAEITTVEEYTSKPASSDTLRASWIARKRPSVRPGGLLSQ